MMALALTIIIIALLLAPLRMALFEVSFVIVLCIPVIAYLLHPILPLNTLGYGAAFIILFAGTAALGYRRRERKSFSILHEAMPFAVFLGAFLITYLLTQIWPDFIAIGERLRDFAILSSVIKSPIDVKEPWLAGFPLNYYAYWYRFGHMLSAVYGLKTYEVYHLLQSFTFALYFTCAFRLLSRYLEVRSPLALFFTALICFGSNLAGVKDYYFEEPGWWGPSRVIPGAINEFPAWSLLLGDLHPHFLNLPVIPLFTLLFAWLLSNFKSAQSYMLQALAALTVCPLLLANSNVWEVPVWLLLAAIVTAFYLVPFFVKKGWRSISEKDSYGLEEGIRLMVALLFIALLSISLFLSRQNIITPDYPVDYVSSEIGRTSLYDLALHFGIPLLIISAWTVLRTSDRLLRAATIFFLFYFFFFKEALPLLLILLGLNAARIIVKFKIFSPASEAIRPKDILVESLGIFSIALLIVPEIVFLNDPYGAEIERMNTIFKIYSAAWFFIHAYAFYGLALAFEWLLELIAARRSKPGRIAARIGSAFSLIILPFIYLTGFFFTTIEERAIRNQVVEPYSQGLSEVDRIFPGAASAIKALQKLPHGIVLEAQGKPYDYTTMIATLSEHTAYLGWANHVNLLLSNPPEVPKRERLTEDLYTQHDCEVKRKIMIDERINYVVLGPLETARYPSISRSDFHCLRIIHEEQSFIIYQVG